MPTYRIPPIRSAAPLRARTLIASVSLLASACSGGGSDGPTPPANTNQTVTSVSVSGNVTTVNVGESVTLSATARNSAGTAVSATFAWTSGNSAVATIGATTGTVTGVAVGSAAITATASGITGTRFISVTTPGQPAPPLANATIDMPGTTFDPSNIRLAVGGTVTFVFTAVAHNVNFSGGAGTPAMIPVTQNASVQRSFPSAGTFSIVCTLHAGMNGTITVQ